MIYSKDVGTQLNILDSFTTFGMTELERVCYISKVQQFFCIEQWYSDLQFAIKKLKIVGLKTMD